MSSVAGRLGRKSLKFMHRWHIALGSVGAKFGLGPGFNLVTNAMVPLRQGGLQPNVTFTTGFEYSF